jgi:hypothetical protein
VFVERVVFGALVDVPLLTAVFVLMLVFRRRLSRALSVSGIPSFVMYLALSVPLIIFEEQIDCEPAWCGKVLVPPTLPFLFVEVLVLGVVALLVHARRTLRVTAAFALYGVIFEILVGGLRGASPLVVVVLAPYVALGYAFISLLPLSVLLEGREESLSDEATIVSPSGSSPAADQGLVLYTPCRGGGSELSWQQ